MVLLHVLLNKDKHFVSRYPDSKVSLLGALIMINNKESLVNPHKSLQYEDKMLTVSAS